MYMYTFSLNGLGEKGGDHKLRKYLSLKLDFEYLKFYWTHCDNNLQKKQNVLLNIFVKCWFITKTTAKVIIV